MTDKSDEVANDRVVDLVWIGTDKLGQCVVVRLLRLVVAVYDDVIVEVEAGISKSRVQFMDVRIQDLKGLGTWPLWHDDSEQRLAGSHQRVREQRGRRCRVNQDDVVLCENIDVALEQPRENELAIRRAHQLGVGVRERDVGRNNVQHSASVNWPDRRPKVDEVLFLLLGAWTSEASTTWPQRAR